MTTGVVSVDAGTYEQVMDVEVADRIVTLRDVRYVWDGLIARSLVHEVGGRIEVAGDLRGRGRSPSVSSTGWMVGVR